MQLEIALSFGASVCECVHVWEIGKRNGGLYKRGEREDQCRANFGF